MIIIFVVLMLVSCQSENNPGGKSISVIENKQFDLKKPHLYWLLALSVDERARLNQDKHFIKYPLIRFYKDIELKKEIGRIDENGFTYKNLNICKWKKHYKAFRRKKVPQNGLVLKCDNVWPFASETIGEDGNKNTYFLDIFRINAKLEKPIDKYNNRYSTVFLGEKVYFSSKKDLLVEKKHYMSKRAIKDIRYYILKKYFEDLSNCVIEQNAECLKSYFLTPRETSVGVIRDNDYYRGHYNVNGYGDKDPKNFFTFSLPMQYREYPFLNYMKQLWEDRGRNPKFRFRYHYSKNEEDRKVIVQAKSLTFDEFLKNASSNELFINDILYMNKMYFSFPIKPKHYLEYKLENFNKWRKESTIVFGSNDDFGGYGQAFVRGKFFELRIESYETIPEFYITTMYFTKTFKGEININNEEYIKKAKEEWPLKWHTVHKTQ